MPLLSPSDGKTYCTIVSGQFSNTHDDNVNTICAFKGDQSCLTEWYWVNPLTVTAINFYTKNYNRDNNIYLIWGRSNGSWVEIWRGTLSLPSGSWYGHGTIASCPNCTGIRIAQYHKKDASTPSIGEIKISYVDVPSPEGEAAIVEVNAPSSFTPGISFPITVSIKNIGSSADVLFIRLSNRDTGEILDEHTVSVNPGQTTVPFSFTIELAQLTNFNARVEAGHEEV